jgi:hypothetical protein
MHTHEAYCENLLLDCDHPIFGGPLFRGKDGRPTKKLKDLESPNSEDAVTWSVFRVLERYFGTMAWPEGLLKIAFGQPVVLGCLEPEVAFWEKVPPPASRLLWLLEHADVRRVATSAGANEDPSRLPRVTTNLAEYRRRILKGQTRGRRPWILEGPTEFDTLIRCPGTLIAIEAKYKSDIDDHIRWDTGRDQIGRVMDVGLALAQQEGRTFYFILITDARQHELPMCYERLMPRYQFDPAFLVEQLPHRSSQDLEVLHNHLGWICWRDIAGWLNERRGALDAVQLEWMRPLESYLRDRSLCQ